MGLFRKKAKIDPQEVSDLRAELSLVRARLDAGEVARQHFENRLETLDVATSALVERSQSLEEITMRMAEIDVLKRQVAQLDVMNAKITSLDTLNGKVSDLNDRVVESSDAARSAREQVAILDERMTSVSTQMVNQISELGREIDEIASRAAAADEGAVAETQQLDPAMLDQIRTAQTKLAQEQARYEIAFRQDLAMLAEQVMRNRPG